MSIKKIKKIYIVLIFVVLLSHFFIANYVKLIGFNYTIKTSGIKTINCDVGYGTIQNCICQGVLLVDGIPPIPPPIKKGFPFATNGSHVNCSGDSIEIESKEFLLAKALNFVYLALLCGIAFGLYKKTPTPIKK